MFAPASRGRGVVDAKSLSAEARSEKADLKVRLYVGRTGTQRFFRVERVLDLALQIEPVLGRLRRRRHECRQPLPAAPADHNRVRRAIAAIEAADPGRRDRRASGLGKSRPPQRSA